MHVWEKVNVRKPDGSEDAGSETKEQLVNGPVALCYHKRYIALIVATHPQEAYEAVQTRDELYSEKVGSSSQRMLRFAHARNINHEMRLTRLAKLTTMPTSCSFVLRIKFFEVEVMSPL